MGSWRIQMKESNRHVRVKGGTPDHSRNLCETCTHATMVQGHAASRRMIQCREISFGDKRDFVPFPVADCSEYKLRGELSLYEMNQMAWLIEAREDKLGFTHRRLTREEIDDE